jgi:hypothetical protein
MNICSPSSVIHMAGSRILTGGDNKMNSFDEISRHLLQFTESADGSTMLVVLAIALAAVVGIVLRVFRARTIRRLQSAAAAYAEREMSQQRRIHTPQLSMSGFRS